MKKYFLNINGQSTGPYSLEELRSVAVQPSTPVWYEGLGGWTVAGNLPELSSLFSISPQGLVQSQPFSGSAGRSNYNFNNESLSGNAGRSKNVIIVTLILVGILALAGGVWYALSAMKDARERLESIERERRDREKEDDDATTYDYDTDGSDNIIEPQVMEAPVEEQVAEAPAYTETQAEFPGGDDKRDQFIRNNVTYPQIVRDNGIEGVVYVRFTIDKDGDVVNPTVIRSSSSPELDAEALRVCKKMPRWKPARQNGSAVSMQYTLPVRFKLQ